jgi:hypothetical protein
MKTELVAAGTMLLLAATPAAAHRLDEYLQATTLLVEKDRVQTQICLTPGVAVFPTVRAGLDTDGDGVISAAEQQAYAQRVLGDLSLTLDGTPLQLRLTSLKFAAIEDLRDGRGEIQLDFDADVASGSSKRKLIFENRHHSRIAAYLVNSLVPSKPGIRITSQYRNYPQSFYQLEYTQDAMSPALQSLGRWLNGDGWLGVVALLMIAGCAVVWQRARATNTSMRVCIQIPAANEKPSLTPGPSPGGRGVKSPSPPGDQGTLKAEQKGWDEGKGSLQT